MTLSHTHTLRSGAAAWLRPWQPDDDVDALTSLIHAAYAPHAARGLRYWGSHQSADDTRKRLASGLAWGVWVNGALAGTITLRGPQPASDVPLYRESDVWSLTQFCIAPGHQGSGLGRWVHDRVAEVARLEGARKLALDTSEDAHGLISMYEAWGYGVVGHCDWRPLTNYRSVLMAKTLHPRA
ncbi:GNAT family N-acetyltransferase [Acidovorax lacteus]|uniref:N-acetyltransferase domain-containing protein n=1 Tax=Acidovorax lacteus TaxID=1924988 RepID=A0ABP8L3J6_9BURK